MTNGAGQSRVCFGVAVAGARWKYVDALQPGAGPPHAMWKDVPGRAKLFWNTGFCYRGTGVFTLRGPAALENAAAFEAVRAGLAQEHVCGGMLALNQNEPHVQDLCNMEVWHNAGRCVACGGKHQVSQCPEEIRAPPNMRGLLSEKKRRLTESQAAQPCQGHLEHLQHLQHLERLPRLLGPRPPEAVLAAPAPGGGRGAAHSAPASSQTPRTQPDAAHPAPAEQPDAAHSAPAAEGARVAGVLEQPPLASRAAWESEGGPRLDEQQLRESLERFRIEDRAGLQASVENALGGPCVDLSRWAADAIYGAYGRQKKAMQGAKRQSSDRALRSTMARKWIKDVYAAKHVPNALAVNKLQGVASDYVAKRRVRVGTPQAEGVAARISDMLALYT